MPCLLPQLPDTEMCNLAKAHDNLVMTVFGEGGTMFGEGWIPTRWAAYFVKRIYLVL